VKGYGSIVSEGEKKDDCDEKMKIWEQLITDCTANVIEFWGFKRNHGRVWSLLYVYERPFCATEIQSKLGLSKGAVSMIIRELEWWKVVHRVRVPSSSSWHFIAETDLTRMIANVVSAREQGLVSKAKKDLVEAESLMKEDENVSPEMIKRVARLKKVAKVIDQTLHIFLKSARFDINKVFSKLKEDKKQDTNSDLWENENSGRKE
jgi:DNA-binding transcriptional regulator GbsR (MarR family)